MRGLAAAPANTVIKTAPASERVFMGASSLSECQSPRFYSTAAAMGNDSTIWTSERFLSLYKTAKGWQIVAKVFTRHP